MTTAMELPHDPYQMDETIAGASNAQSLSPIESLLVSVNDEEEDPASNLPQNFGNYRLIKLLGKGGMGVVYEAEQIATGRPVAVKMLAAQLNSQEVRRRFLREGRLAAGVSHPNSVYVFGTEEIEGMPVITMEVAGGGTLQDRLDRRGPLPVVDKAGKPASRVRLLCRWTIVWTPILLMFWIGNSTSWGYVLLVP